MTLLTVPIRDFSSGYCFLGREFAELTVLCYDMTISFDNLVWPYGIFLNFKITSDVYDNLMLSC